MGEPRLDRVVFREAQAARTPFVKAGSPAPTPEPVHDLKPGLIVDGRPELGTWPREQWGMHGDPEGWDYAVEHLPVWPETQTSWFKHLTRVCEKSGGTVAKSKLRTVAKRLYIEQQSMSEYDFAFKYSPTIPDKDWHGGLPDHRLHELADFLSNLVGRHREQGAPAKTLPKQPVRLYTLEEASELLGVTPDVIRNYATFDADNMDYVRVGHNEWRLKQRVIDELRGKLERP